MRKRPFLPSEVRRITGNGDTLRSLHREIDRIFDNFHVGFDLPAPFASLGRGHGSIQPRIDMTESDKAIEVTVELPGVSENDMEVTISDNVLTVKGEKTSEKTDEEADVHVVERSYGSFRRSIALPCDVATDAVNASFSDGVLKVVLPKPPESTTGTQRIEIKPAA